MLRGTVCWVNLEDAHPPEFGKTRPALIVSNTEQNTILHTVVVVPVSTQPGEIWPLRLKLPSLRGLKAGFAVIPGLRQVAKTRLSDPVGIVPETFLGSLTEAVQAYLED